MADKRTTIEEMTEGATPKEKRDRKNWVAFVESDAVNFLTLNEIEKMTLDDGEGNKAKLTRRKDGSVYVECTSSNVL
ncbi:MAG TPA: hypothetical protein PKJ47_10605 [Candidatus Limiplasma sp.]|nr:hypothetical protein [Candidatus Limiplasma sp.]